MVWRKTEKKYNIIIKKTYMNNINQTFFINFNTKVISKNSSINIRYNKIF